MRRSRTGLTLIEVIISMAILGMIGMLSWSTLASSMSVREAMDAAEGSSRTARIAMGRITRELQLAYLTQNTRAVNTYQTVFVGKDEDDTDMLWFSSLSHHRKIRDSRECDQTEITLFTDADPDESDHLVLYHREAPRIDQYPDKDGKVLPLAKGVTRFDLLYMDSRTGEWLDEWDTAGVSTPGQLPRAVQIVLTLATADPDDEDDFIVKPYVSTVMLAMATAQTRSVFARGGQ